MIILCEQLEDGKITDHLHVSVKSEIKFYIQEKKRNFGNMWIRLHKFYYG